MEDDTEAEATNQEVINASQGNIILITGVPNARRPGAPTKYKPATVTRLINAVSDGLGLKAACSIAGISYSTLMEWQKEKPELAEKLEQAKEKAALLMLRRIKVAAADDWRAAEAYLKLTRPEIFKWPPQPQQQNHLHVHGDTKVTLSIERQQEIREQRKRIMATVHDTAPANQARIQPTGFLVRPEERERSEAETQPVQDAEVIAEQPAAQQQSARRDEQSAAHAIWNTYQRNGDEQEQSGDDDLSKPGY